MDKISKIKLSDLKIGEKFGRTPNQYQYIENNEVIKRNKAGRIKVKIWCGNNIDFWIFDFPASKIVYRKNEK